MVVHPGKDWIPEGAIDELMLWTGWIFRPRALITWYFPPGVAHGTTGRRRFRALSAIVIGIVRSHGFLSAFHGQTLLIGAA